MPLPGFSEAFLDHLVTVTAACFIFFMTLRLLWARPQASTSPEVPWFFGNWSQLFHRPTKHESGPCWETMPTGPQPWMSPTARLLKKVAGSRLASTTGAWGLHDRLKGDDDTACEPPRPAVQPQPRLEVTQDLSIPGQTPRSEESLARGR